MSHPTVHKGIGQSQLSKIDTGILERNGLTRTHLVGRPHTMRHDTPDQTMPQGSKRQTDHPNVNKAPRWSQLSKTDMGALKRNDSTRTERA